MDVAALFLHNMEHESLGYAFANYSAELRQDEKDRIHNIMKKIGVEKKMVLGFNTWIFLKNSFGSQFSVKRFTWDGFDINGSLDEIEKQLIKYTKG